MVGVQYINAFRQSSFHSSLVELQIRVVSASLSRCFPVKGILTKEETNIVSFHNYIEIINELDVLLI